MTVGVRLLLSSMAFGLLIALAYWLCSRDPTGTLLLALLAGGLAFVAAYILIAERQAALPGDAPFARPGDAADDDQGIFTVRSPWPILLALTVAATLIGILVAPVLALGAASALILISWQLVCESR